MQNNDYQGLFFVQIVQAIENIVLATGINKGYNRFVAYIFWKGHSLWLLWTMGSIVEDKKKYIISILFFGLLLALTFWLIFKDQDMLSVLPAVLKANPLFVALGMLCMFGFICCEAANIYFLSNTFRERVRFKSCLKYAFVGFYFSSITPSSSGGQPAQVYYMNKDNVKVGASTLSFLIMLASLQCVTLLLGIVMLCLKGGFIFANMGGIWVLFIYGSLFYLFLIFIIVFAIYSQSLLKKLAVGVVALLSRLHLIKNQYSMTKKTLGMVENYASCAGYIKRNPSVLFKTMGISTCQILFQFSVPYFVYKAFGLSAYSYLDILALQTVLTICVSSLPLPGAVGASEGSFLKMFFVIFGQDFVLPAMLLNRGVSFYLFLILSGIVTMAAHFKVLKRDRLLKK